MKSIQIGCEYPWVTVEQGIFLVQHYGEHGGGHGTNGVYFPRGGKLIGYKWDSSVKLSGLKGHEVLSCLAVSLDGKNSFAELGAWHHWKDEEFEDSSRHSVVMFPSGELYPLKPKSYIHIKSQGYPLPREPVPEGMHVEFQVTLYVKCKEFEVK